MIGRTEREVMIVKGCGQILTGLGIARVCHNLLDHELTGCRIRKEVPEGELFWDIVHSLGEAIRIIDEGEHLIDKSSE